MADALGVSRKGSPPEGTGGLEMTVLMVLESPSDARKAMLPSMHRVLKDGDRLRGSTTRQLANHEPWGSSRTQSGLSSPPGSGWHFCGWGLNYVRACSL